MLKLKRTKILFFFYVLGKNFQNSKIQMLNYNESIKTTNFNDLKIKNQKVEKLNAKLSESIKMTYYNDSQVSVRFTKEKNK